jgi:hypothetical protein
VRAKLGLADKISQRRRATEAAGTLEQFFHWPEATRWHFAEQA